MLVLDCGVLAIPGRSTIGRTAGLEQAVARTMGADVVDFAPEPPPNV